MLGEWCILSNSLRLIADNIGTWWTFLWQTLVPGTSFSFGALYTFILFVSIGLFMLRLALGNKNKDGD